MTSYFIDKDGRLIGGFDGGLPPDWSILVPNPPENALKYKYINGDWVKDVDVQADREEAYLKAGITDHAVVSALWEFYSEAKSDDLNELKLKKEAVDILIPNK